jgi:hypothetical protein
MASMDSDGANVVRNVILGAYPTPIVFFKQMTHHLVELDRSFLDTTVNVILTRDPHDMLRSYAAVVEAPGLLDTGYLQNAQLLAELRARGQDPVVLDSTVTLQDPEGVLRRLCDRLGIDVRARDAVVGSGTSSRGRRVGATLVRIGSSFLRVRCAARSTLNRSRSISRFCSRRASRTTAPCPKSR